MIILANIFKLHLVLIYALLKLLPIDNKKIVFISRSSNKPSKDFILLKEEILKQNDAMEIIFLCKKIGKGLPNIIKYYFTILKQMYHLATTNTAVIDTYIIPVSILNHKKELTVIQIWHAMSAIKQFGYQTIGLEYGRESKLAKIMNMHNNYDVIFTGSKTMIPYFKKAYKAEDAKYITTLTPSVEFVYNNKEEIKEQIYKEYPDLRSKKNIIYAPTFRVGEEVNYDLIIDDFDFEKYNLIIKSHPNRKNKIKDDRIYKCKEFSTLELLTIADSLITDYSSIAIEAAIFNTKLFFYLYDYEKYIKYNGLNVDLFKEMPNATFTDNHKLLNSIESDKYDFKKLKEFKNKYAQSNIENTTFKIAKFILTKEFQEVKNEKKN